MASEPPPRLGIGQQVLEAKGLRLLEMVGSTCYRVLWHRRAIFEWAQLVLAGDQHSGCWTRLPESIGGCWWLPADRSL